MARVTVVADKAAMSETAAERITSAVRSVVAARGSASLSLTGGGSPDVLYQFMADADRPWRHAIDWAQVHLFWGDERAVPPDDPQSNFGLANHLLVQHVPIPAAQVHRMRGELPAEDAGRLYDALLRTRRDETVGPLFDVMLLGIGSNAHIASLFPDSPLLSVGDASKRSEPERPERSERSERPEPERLERSERPERSERLAAGVYVPEISQWRITMTPAALLDSAAIVMLASGASKAEAIAAAIEGREDIPRYPAQLLRTAGNRVEWIIDAAASARLRGVPPA
jgi:6-phosphogluconolactonase